MQYTALDGTRTDGEVWAAGPLFGTVWVLRIPDSRPAVVHLAKKQEVEYTAPAPPSPRLDPAVLEKANDIRRRNVSHDPFLKRYRPPVGKKPTKAEVDAAQYVFDYEKARIDAEKLFRDHHTASTPVAAKRILEEAGIELPKRTTRRSGTSTPEA